jgi:hypothetical protein
MLTRFICAKKQDLYVQKNKLKSEITQPLPELSKGMHFLLIVFIIQLTLVC